jgi:protocatechuate 4,5-dioxygenase beta chain
MATIVGGITTSHIPAIANAIANKSHEEPYWKPFFDAYPPIREWLNIEQPDVAVVIYNDHGLAFFLDQMPTFAIGAAHGYRNEDEGWGIPTVDPFEGNPKLSWHIIEQMVADEFDITSCQEMAVDHGFTVPMQLFWPDRGPNMPTVVPIVANTVQHPIPTMKRCLDFGRSLGRAIRSYPDDSKVVVLGTGGLSHQLDGERAGFINPEFDQMCMEKLVSDPDELTAITRHDLITQAGTQGSELIMWMMMRGALSAEVTLLHQNYHVPISNTGAGTMLLGCRH